MRNRLCSNAIIPLILAASLLLGATKARADYQLDSGDILEISIFGVADFKRRVTVNIDGNVSVPFLGEVTARGRTLTQLRQEMTRELVANGRIREPDVTIELVEYRPFYISGDVARPGAHAFMPGLSVRNAVALAGGYDALRFRAENPLLMAPELRSQYDSLWIDIVKKEARVISLNAQLQGRDQFDAKPLRDAPVQQSSVEQIIDLETKDLAIRIADFEKQKTFLADEIATADKNIAALKTALGQQDQLIHQQEEASARTASYMARGVSPVMRVDEERRALASLHSQQLDTTARLAQARKDRDELKRNMERAADEHLAKLIRDLQDASTELEKAKAQLHGVGEKLLYAGALKAQMRRGGNGPEIVLYRKVDGQEVSLPATESTQVEPGDVVDVLVRPDQLVITPRTQ
jgi:polysaccharide export outer membrane protein